MLCSSRLLTEEDRSYKLAEFRQTPVGPQLCGREEGRHREAEGFLAVEEEEEVEVGFSVCPTV